MHRFSSFSFGGLLVVFAPMVRMIFGSKFYNRNYGLIFIGYGIGAFVGPKISAYFYDTTGQYTMGFIGSAVLAVAAIVLIVIAQKMASKMEMHSKKYSMKMLLCPIL